MIKIWLSCLMAALALVAFAPAATAKGKVKRKGSTFVLPDGERIVMPREQAACVGYSCMDSTSGVSFSMCVAQRCGPTQGWELALVSIEENGGSTAARVRLHAIDTGYGYDGVDTSQPLYVGLTVLDRAGAEIDAPPITLLNPTRDQTISLVAPAAPVSGFIVAAWSKKLPGCVGESSDWSTPERMGCRKYGFLLDGPVASIPPGAYDEFYQFERPLQSKEPYEVRIVSHRASKKALEVGRAAVFENLREILAPYGVEPLVVDGGKAKQPCRQVVVRSAAEYEGSRAALLARGLSRAPWPSSRRVSVDYEEVESSPVPLIVCIGAL